ncbi:hypothetical protein VTL71DRAFT_8488 [Oculimacula yallundae]|uniref:BZIP domain-containing protein n=1 Tax=Oculimacula yallundae TaxID=86028 RepID=A0ABR4CXS5_9HELO
MFLAAENLPKPKKKSPRSNSPRAVQRRREQNRLSQRNHRRRIRKEVQGGSSESEDGDLSKETTSQDTTRHSRRNQHVILDTNSGIPISSPSSQSNATACRPSISIETMMNYPFMGGDLQSQPNGPWPVVDMTMRQPSTGLETPISNSDTALCTCSHHNTNLGNQAASEETTSPLSQRQNNSNHRQVHTPQYYMPTYSAPFLDSLGQAFNLSPCQNTSGQRVVEPNERSRFNSSETGHRSLYQNQRSPNDGRKPMVSSGMSITSEETVFGISRNLSPELSPPQSAVYLSKDSLNNPRITNVDPTIIGLTQRFETVLEAMRQAGFQDFDGMAVAYYTGEFEKGSVPAMLQCSSRSRRLRAMLQQLQESSSQWLRWEARGLHQSMSEAAATICVEEIERLTQADVKRSAQAFPPALVTAIERLLIEHGRSCNGQGGGSMADHLSNAPDIIPHLWSILTELAGVDGVYCDEIARVLLLILVYAREN